MSDVLTHTHGSNGKQIGHISLNRPRALHSLTLDMCQAMIEALLAWRDDPEIKAVILDHAEGRGFCAGGDVTLVRNSALEDGGKAGRAFFHTEYQLNHLLFTYPKPVVAFMDGITMGGGVGIAQPARYRVVTENTRYAMPETGIGLICDVGGGWYLPRLPGQIGKFLGLTGARLDGAECLWAGLGTHYLESSGAAESKARIVEDPDRIEMILDSLKVPVPEPRLRSNKAAIDSLFSSETLADIMSALEADGSKWAMKELRTLQAKSPMACELVLRQLREGASATSFAENMVMEYRASGRTIMLPDFAEGVRALLIDKTNDPKWTPADPAGIDPAAVDAVFAPLSPEEEWKPL